MPIPAALIPLLEKIALGVGSAVITDTILRNFDNSSEAITAMLGEINQTLLDGFAGCDVDLESVFMS